MVKMRNGFVVLASVLITIGFVSLGSAFWPFDDEVQESPFDSTVVVGNELPVIISTDVPDPVDPFPGTPVVAGLSFIAEDLNGQGTIDATTAELYVDGPGPGFYNLEGSCAEAPSCTSCAGGNKMNVSCSVTMEHYYDPGTWNIVVAVNDTSGSEAKCGVGVSVVCPSFTYTTTVELDAQGATMNWATLSLSGTDQPADGSLALLNRGNLVANAVDISAFNLFGLSDNSLSIPSERFSASGYTSGAECDWDVGFTATQLGVSGVPALDIVGINVPYGPPGSDSNDSYFCIWDSLSDLGLSSQSYSTTEPVFGTSWEITA